LNAPTAPANTRRITQRNTLFRRHCDLLGKGWVVTIENPPDDLTTVKAQRLAAWLKISVVLAAAGNAFPGALLA